MTPSILSRISGLTTLALAAGVMCCFVSSEKVGAEDSLKGTEREVQDLKVTALDLDAKLVLHCMTWADKEGKAFFVLDSNGLLKKVSFPDFKVLKTKDFERKCAWMALSSEGLLITAPEPKEVWILDTDSLEVKRKMEVPGLLRAVGAPASAVGVASNGKALFVLPLKKGKPIPVIAAKDFLSAGFTNPVMSPNGEYVFAQGGIEQLFRYRFVKGRLKFEEKSDRIAQGRIGSGIQVSPDSTRVCLPCGGGNYGAKPAYSTYVYSVKSFKKVDFTLEQGAYPLTVGFDSKGGYVFAQNRTKDFILYGMTGIKKKEYAIDPKQDVRQYLAHPEGNKVLMLNASKIYLVEVPPKAK